MKKKTFILTLMMMFCSFVFGQNQWHWQEPSQGEYQSSMTLIAIVQIDNENQSRADLEMAAFHNGVVRGITKTQVGNYNGVPASIVVLTIRGDHNYDDIMFKLYVPPTDGNDVGKELVTDLVIPFRAESFIGNITPEVINFYEVHWSSDIVYEQTMTVGCVINIDGVPYEGTDVEVAAFCNEEVRGVGRPVYWEETGQYYTELFVGGKSKGETISFKLYHPEYGELDTDYTVPFENGATIADENNQAVPINFIYNSYVAQIGTTKYPTLEAAVDAVGTEETITVLKDITLDETLTIAAEKNFTIDLNGNDIAADLDIYGNIIVTGEGDFNVNVVLAKETATLTAVQDLNVTTNVNGYSVVNENGVYKLVEIVYVAQVGSTKYETLAEAYAAANETNGIVLLSNITLQSAWKIEKAINIALNGKTVKGTIELANVGATVTGQSSEMTVTSGVERYMVVYENDVYKLEKEPSGKIAYRAYVYDTEEREGVQVDLLNIIAKQSVVVKLYDANGNVLTTTSLKAGAAEAEGLTCNIVLWGNPSSSWETTKHTALTVANVPAKIELWIDGTLKDTFENALGAGTNVDETAKYLALDCVYKEAKINNTYYATLQAAIAAAKTGDTIVLLADVTLANAIDITGKTIDLNGNNLKGNVIGTIRTNGGLYTTAENFKMIGVGADYYKTSDATVVIANAAITIAEGTVELAQSWNTLENQTLTVAEGAAFVVPSSMTFELNGTAIVSGTLTVNGQIILANKNATLKAVDGLNVATNIADYKVVYENSMYKVVAKVYVAQVGETKYESLEEAIAAVPANQTITVLKDITLAQTLTIAAEKNFTLDLNGKAINTGFQQNSTDKHIYAFDNKGTLTLANGTINARGIYNYGTLTVNANATINSIDANGGYGVGNYGTLNVYGTIATTNEDNDAPESGNYDATPINNRTNATVNVFEGSVIANVSNFTYGIENNGTLNITGGTISSKHSTIGNYGAMTVEGGTIICDGYEGVSSQVIVAWNGSTTNIKGGTFDGKDNNNGFNVDAEAGAKVYISGGNFLSCYSGSLYGAGTIEVSGGKFFDAVPENRCAEGYIPTQFTDGTYGVKVGSYIAQIGTTKYETFEAAYAAAQTDDVIELFRTVVLTSDSDYNKEVTVKAEFNETAFRVKANVSFNNMTIISDDYCVIVGAEDGAGKLTINGGTYKGETTAVSVTKGDVKIMGGTFEVEPYQGSYEYTINCIDANYNQTAKVSIQGGKFYNFNPMNNAAEGVGTNFVVANHITVKDTENYWTVVALPTTDKIVSSEDHTVTSNGYGPATVTVTGEVPCVANGQGIVSSWIGFRITKPEGVDANVARVFTPGSNGTYNEKTLASILDDGKDYASMWVSIQYKRVFDYKVDWNNDGIIDLVINIDATAATIKHNYVEVERVEPSYGQDGYIKYQCGCGHVYTETLPAEFAKIAETEVIYSTIEAAIAAAQSGQTIVVLANVETTNVAFALPANVTLDLNGKTVKADIIGTVKTNGGLWITSTGHKMLGKGADIYSTENATVVNSANEVNIVSGAITLAATEWWTLQDQNLTIAENATFTIPATSKFNVMNGTTVTVNGTAINDGTLVIYGTAIVNGTITVNGTVELATLTATLKAQAGLNVITNITDYKVVYADGMYKVVQAIYEQRRTLGAGWNWFSSYINISGEEGLQALEAALGTSGLQIKGQLGFVDYSTGWGWNGTLVSASVEEMFMIQTSKEVELVLTGELANPATPITLQKNWTYIGYPVSEPMNLEYALANITPNDGDIIKTHNGGVAQYNAEWNTWYSQSLTSMTPGMGYMYRNTSGTTKTLVYPTPNAQTRAEVRANVTTEDNHWAPNASAFANNMNIIAVLENNDMMGEFEVAAFVNGEVRGSARPTYVEPIDAYVLFMTIYGEEGDEVTFKYYDIYSDEEHVISNTVAYSDDAVIGSISEPYMFFANTLGLGENAASTLSIYPNPTTTNAAISFETTFDMVEVFNSLGAKVAEYRNVDRIEGMEAAGVYVIRVTNDNAVQNCRLIVK